MRFGQVSNSCIVWRIALRPTDPLNILVFGAGAIGGYLGASMAQQGHAITFLERPHNIDVLRAKGISLTINDERLHLDSFSYASSIAEALAYGPFNVAFFALKSYDTQEAIQGLNGFVDKLPPFLCLQNGVDNEIALAKVLGAERVIAGAVTTAIGKPALGKLVLEKKRGIAIAAKHPLATRLTIAMNAAGLKAQAYEDALAMKWSKLLTNLLANAQSAIRDLSPAQILAQRASYTIEMQQLREALAVMKALKLKPTDLPGTPVRALAFAASYLPMSISQSLVRRAAGSGRGGKMPSLHIDLHQGKGKSEVGWLNGAVVKWGKKYGIATPINQKLVDDLQRMINMNKSKATANS